MSTVEAIAVSVRIRLFGALRVMVAGHPEVDQFPTRKIAQALAYLALHQGEPQSREDLGELLWPEADLAAQRVRLNTVVYNLRRILEPVPLPTGSVLFTGRHQITLLREGVSVDSREFEALIASAHRRNPPPDSVEKAEILEQAVALYQDKLLPGFYEEDFLREQERMEHLCFEALLDLAAAWDATGEEASAKAIAAARRAVALEPLSETANATLIRLQANAGQTAAAFQSYKRMEALFRQELDTAPPASLRELLISMRPASPAVSTGEPPPEPPIPNNLPAPLTSFVGRVQECGEIARYLHETRLLTLSGTGGVGKTRLALQVASNLLEETPEPYPDGIWMVELAPLFDPALVPQTVAATLGITESPGQASVTQTLAEALKAKRLLILLDNCEHLVAACANLAAALLRACPHVTILTTSREPLGIGGETTYHIPSLSLPDPKREHEVESLTQFESVRLFIDRALAVKPGFRVTNRNAPALAQLCCHLDGLPLAIELAAARIRSLSVEQINDRLDSRFRLLTGGDRSALPRQQTLRALIDWSYDLLSENEKALLARLSVFAGSWTLSAAEKVCSFETVSDWEVLDLLTSLTDKSLVLFEEGSEPSNASRYRMLETVREYAAEKQAETENADALPARHIDFFTALVEEAEANLAGPEEETWLNRLESEHDNLRTALQTHHRIAAATVEETPDTPISLTGLRLGTGLWRFWMVRGYPSEGREHLDRALELVKNTLKAENANDSEKTTAVKRAMARALRASGRLAWIQGDYATARSLLEEGLELHRSSGDNTGIAGTLSSLGLVVNKQGDFRSAQSMLEESLERYRKAGDRNGIASSLGNLGLIAYNQCDYVTARGRYEEALALDRKSGDRHGMANSLSSLGNIAFDLDDFPTAQALYDESLALSREIGDKQGTANTLGNLGNVACELGDYDTAWSRYDEGLAILREMGDKFGTAIAIGNLGGVARKRKDFGTARGYMKESLRLYIASGDRNDIAYGLEGVASVCESDYRLATTLWAVSQELRKSIGAPLPPGPQAHIETMKAAAREALGEAEYETIWNEGQNLPWEKAVELALDGPSLPAAAIAPNGSE